MALVKHINDINVGGAGRRSWRVAVVAAPGERRCFQVIFKIRELHKLKSQLTDIQYHDRWTMRITSLYDKLCDCAREALRLSEPEVSMLVNADATDDIMDSQYRYPVSEYNLEEYIDVPNTDVLYLKDYNLDLIYKYIKRHL